jgi:hypothetical protein
LKQQVKALEKELASHRKTTETLMEKVRYFRSKDKNSL